MRTLTTNLPHNIACHLRQLLSFLLCVLGTKLTYHASHSLPLELMNRSRTTKFPLPRTRSLSSIICCPHVVVFPVPLFFFDQIIIETLMTSLWMDIHRTHL